MSANLRFIHFDEYRDHLTKDVPYDGKPEGRMIYVDDQFSQAILLCHFLFPSAAILNVFKEKINLTGIRRFRIIIRRHYLLPIAEERLKSMTPEERLDESQITVELNVNIDSQRRSKHRQRNILPVDDFVGCTRFQLGNDVSEKPMANESE